MIRLIALCCVAFWASAGWALDLSLPSNARITVDRVTDPDGYALPTGPYADGALPVMALEGRVLRRAWRIDGQNLTTVQLLAPLRAQLQQAGYTTEFECDSDACGGFDFRFETEVLPAPQMHISLTDFHFLTAQNGPDDHLSLLISRSANAGYLQLIRVTGPTAKKVNVTLSAPPQVAATDGGRDLAAALAAKGFAVLSDLDFGTGTSDLGKGPYASLSALAEFMAAQPKARIALVGHTDAVGGLDGNISLSKRRAGSVLERLASAYGVPRDRMDAEGMGYLSPIAPNATVAGREANRRVEVILLNTE